MAHRCKRWDVWFVQWWHDDVKRVFEDDDEVAKARRAVYMADDEERLLFLYVSTVKRDGEERIDVRPVDPEFKDTGLSPTKTSYVYPQRTKALEEDDILEPRRRGFLGPGYQQQVLDAVTRRMQAQRRRP